MMYFPMNAMKRNNYEPWFAKTTPDDGNPSRCLGLNESALDVFEQP